ncbi:hypothetical protein C8N40_10910 [Pontibacter mucosus]|uniref:O-antigen ligase-related domain-containing protein n=1 Tax=Pontibacter mucosus TaxID=1649266 RepID=A0A2T5YDX6_9BACT|nr:O-antigen ligase family protein [Pontibacter mucosus]PTX14913.1 hypothetical protein C8N40_10910 [Pontibacter mucosus]
MLFSNLKIYNGKLYFILLLIVAVLTPTAEGLPVKLASLSVILLTLHWLISGEYAAKLEKLKRNKLLWLFLSLFLINLVGLYRVGDLKEASDILIRKLPILLFPLIIGTSDKLTKNQINYIITAFIVGLFLTSLFTFREGIAVVLDRQDLTTMVELTLLHRPYSGLFSLFAIVGLVRFYTSSNSVALRAFLIVAILYFLFFIYVIYVKMTIVALLTLLALFAIIWLIKRWGKYPVIVLGGMLFLSASWYIGTNEKAGTVIKKIIRSEDFSYQEYNIHLVSSINIRYINWGCSFKVLGEDKNWLTGLGVGNTQEKLNLCYKNLNPWIYENEMNAHNEYLEEMLRNGLTGLLILVLCLAVPTAHSLKHHQYTYLGFLILIIVCCITENVLSRQAGIMFYALFNSVFAFNTFNSGKWLRKKEVTLANQSS